MSLYLNLQFYSLKKTTEFLLLESNRKKKGGNHKSNPGKL